MEEVDHHAALLNVNLSGVVARFVSKSFRTGVCPLLLLFVPHAGCNLRSMHAMRGVRVLACCSTRKRSTRFVVRHNGQKLYPSKDSNLLCSAGNSSKSAPATSSILLSQQISTSNQPQPVEQSDCSCVRKSRLWPQTREIKRTFFYYKLVKCTCGMHVF